MFRDCNSFLVPTETVALPGNIFGGVYVPGKYGKRVGFSKMLLQRGNVFIFKNVRFQRKSSFYFIFHLQRGNVFIFKNVRFQRKSSFYFIFHLQRGNVFIFKNNNCIGSYSFKPDPDPAKKLNTDPDPDPGPCFSKSIFAIASFSAVARLRVSRRQIAFASRTPRREDANTFASAHLWLLRFIFPTGVIFVVWKTMIQLSFFQHAFSMVVNPCVLCCNISHPNLFCPD